MLSAELHEGMIVGYHGLRAVVRGVNHQSAYLHWREELPRRKHRDCDGTGKLLVLNRDDTVSLVGCPACQATGQLPAQTVTRRAWVALDELTAAPPKPPSDPAMVARAADLLRGPR